MGPASPRVRVLRASPRGARYLLGGGRRRPGSQMRPVFRRNGATGWATHTASTDRPTQDAGLQGWLAR
jgi:hypothetical protein